MTPDQCPGARTGGIPSNLLADNPAIPQDKNVAGTGIGIRNTTRTTVEACCAPNEIHLLDDCFWWCQVPDDVAENLPADLEPANDFFWDWLTCVSATRTNLDEPIGYFSNKKENTGVGVRAPSVRRGMVVLGIWALVLVGGLMS